MSPSGFTGRKGHSPRAQTRRPAPSTVSGASLESIGRFVRILARCGATPNDIVRAVRIAAARIPGSWAVRARKVTREIDDAAHVLTVWFSEAAYLDPSGRPRALPLEGASKSVAALVRSVDQRFNAREVLAYLVRSGAVRRHGKRYVPRARMLLLRGARGPDYFRTLRVLTHMLGTLEHNVLPKRAARGWFEYFAENPRFPARAREGLDKYVAALGKEVLSRLDTYMRRREVNRKPSEPTLRVGVGMHLWEGQPRTFRKHERAVRLPRSAPASARRQPRPKGR
jgi:hypothetical protein